MAKNLSAYVDEGDVKKFLAIKSYLSAMKGKAMTNGEVFKVLIDAYVKIKGIKVE